MTWYLFDRISYRMHLGPFFKAGFISRGDAEMGLCLLRPDISV